HLAMGVFDTFQIPYSALERDHEAVITDAAATGAGTIIRGGVARGAPDKETTPLARGARVAHWEERNPTWRGDRERAGVADLLHGGSRAAFMVRFTIPHPALHTTIVGTVDPEHLAANVAAAAKGPLPPDVYEAAKARLG